MVAKTKLRAVSNDCHAYRKVATQCQRATRATSTVPYSEIGTSEGMLAADLEKIMGLLIFLLFAFHPAILCDAKTPRLLTAADFFIFQNFISRTVPR